MSFPLQTLLDDRLRAEEQAERALTGAVAARVACEASQRRLEECAAAARAHVSASRSAYDGTPTTAARVLEGERFRVRLAHRAQHAGEAALTHRNGMLAAAREAEAVAREALAAARRERETLELVKEREDQAQRRLAERRAEDAAGDLASSRRPRRR